MQDAATPTLPPNAAAIAVALAIAVVVAAAIALIAGGLARRLFTSVGSDSISPTITQATVRLVRLTTFAVVLVMLAFPALDLAGVRTPMGLQSDQLAQWAAQKGVRIVALLVIAFAVVRLIVGLITRAERDIAIGTDIASLERRKRAQTVASLAKRALGGLIWAIAALMVLRELDVDITPVLTGAGILGLAVGFGAQTLVRDVISGFFLIVEDQVRVGDVASVNGQGGFVEQINLRTIVLRDEAGAVHVIPNGEIKTLANLTKDFSYYVIPLGIDFDEDTDRVVDVARQIAGQLKQDPTYGPFMLEPLEVWGVDEFSPSQVTVKLRLKTVPLKQWEVGREFRRRLKKAFDERGIRLPTSKLAVTLQRELGDAEGRS